MPRFVLALSLVCFGQLRAGVLTPTGSLNAVRELHTATQLATGKVLVAGGAADRTALSSAEVYDLDSETWVITSPMNTPRASHTATSLPALPANAAFLPNGALQFAFTNTPATPFSVLASSFPGLPIGEWTVLGTVTETSPGQYQFTDTQATNYPARYYRLRSP